jgi:hypothetical protein
MMSTDATAIAWYGVGSPEICFSGKFTKEGNLKDDARLTVDVQEADLAVICDNLLDTAIKCQAGTGNTGGTVVDLDPKTVVPDPNSNNQSFSGCIDLSKWFNHKISGHTHICSPTTNTNLVEVLNSGHVVTLKGSYTLIRSISAPNDKVAGTGSFSCTWSGVVNPVPPGSVNSVDCQAEQKKCFTCTQTCFDGQGKQVVCETVPSFCVP